MSDAQRIEREASRWLAARDAGNCSAQLVA
jgi:hypothetical protein